MKKILIFKGNSRLCYTLFLQLLLLPAYAFQQQYVTGLVTDASGALPGVIVTLKDTPTATLTDQNGYYVLEAQPGQVLVFSYLGYQTQEVAITENTINIFMEPDATMLAEVEINAGYYTVKDRERTGSIARVTAKDIEKQPVSNPLAAMQGIMAGVDIVQNSGVPGGGFEVKIRGRNSIMAGNNPLYIIDGVPYDAQTMGSSFSVGGIIPSGNISPLNAINPAIIESIEVLKDADATAIYGSRGANGVVLITTKKGQQGKTNFVVGYSKGMASVTRTRELMNTEQYLEMRREAFANDGITEYPANAYDVNGRWDPNRYTDWQKELIGGTAETNSIQASVSGGNEQTQFLLSGMYQNETTVFPGDFNYDRITVNSNIRHTSTDKRFQMTFSTGYTIENNLLPGNDLTFDAIRLAPNAPALYDQEGNLNWEESTWTNPLAALEGKYSNNSNSLLANSVMSYRVYDNIKLKINSGYNYMVLEDANVIPHTVYDPAYGMNSSVSQAFSHSNNRSSFIIEPQISWSKQRENHSWNLLLGATFQKQKNEKLTLFGFGFANNSFLGNLNAANMLMILEENAQEYNYQSVFARVNYDYKKKLFLNITGRRDGSSRFSTENRYGNFGAIGAGWLFSEDLNVSWLPFGKLRGSFGLTGNDQIGDYQYLQTYMISDFPYDGNIGLLPARLYNPNFGWEENLKKEAALELGLFDQRVMLTTAYYNNRSSNQLINYALPGTTGFSSIQANLDAVVENSGWEFEVSTEILNRNNFTWNSSLNFSLPSTKLLEFDDLENSSYASQFVIGEPLTIYKLYKLNGVNQQTGLFEFEDFNGDGQITASEDREYVADLTPKFFGGLSNNLSYKNWEFDFFFQFVKKQGMNEFFGGQPSGMMTNQTVSALDRWQDAGDQTAMQQFTTGGNAEALLAYSKFNISSGAVSDASFVRLKSMALSYNLPLGKDSGNSCRISLQGQNLLTFTKYKAGDPEQLSGFLPPLKRITLGVQLYF
jgi:TonB-linked SusC/RagA family outer membrane protein